MKGFCCANTCSLSFLKWMLSVLMQIPLPEVVVWNLLSCGHWNLKFCNYSWHMLLKISAYWAFFRVTENQALSCHGFFCSASNGWYTLVTFGSAVWIVIHKSNVSKEEIPGMWLVEAFFQMVPWQWMVKCLEVGVLLMQKGTQCLVAKVWLL